MLTQPAHSGQQTRRSGILLSMAFFKQHSRAIIIICLVLIGPSQVFAQDATLTNIIVTNTRDDLLIYLTVEGAFREEMEDAIKSGVPTTFSFFINIYRQRTLWPDKNIAELRVLHTIKYNNLKEEFVIKRSWEAEKEITVKTFDEAKKLMSEIDSLKIIPLSELEKGKQYQIQAKAQLSKVTLPFYLHYVLFFISMWDFETDWYTIDFIY
jgi:hypothetical protein